MPEISVIIPVYNCERFLTNSMSSILQQTYQDFEIILVDDGSKDDSLAIMQKLAEHDVKIKVVHQENAGVSEARNTGMKLATGKYFVFCDADDEMPPDALETYMSALNEFDYDLLIAGFTKQYYAWECGNKRVEKEIEYIPQTEQYTDKRQVISNLTKIARLDSSVFDAQFFNSLWNKIYKAELIRKNCLHFEKDVAMGEDLRFNIAYVNCVRSIAVLPKQVYTYCVNTESATFRFREEDFAIRCETNRQMKALFIKNGQSVPNILYVLDIILVYSTCANFYLKSNTNNRMQNKQLFTQMMNNPNIIEALSQFRGNTLFLKLAHLVLKTKNYVLIMSAGYILYQLRKRI